MNDALSRRDFLRTGPAALATLPLAGSPPQETGRTYTACVIGNTRRGGYGHGLDMAFQKIPNVHVAAVADPDEKGRLAARERTGAARAYADWREMIQKERPNLVSIGPRWVEQRLEMVSAAAEAGAHVFMEKPVAASLEEADAIVAVAERHKVRIAVAHHARIYPSVQHLKKLVDEGLLGDLLEVRARGKEDHRSGGEDLMVLGTHGLYLMRYFAGEPLWCSARVTEKGRNVTANDRRAATEPLGPVAGDTIHAAYAFPNGVQGHFASQKTKPGGRFQVALYGSKGAAVIRIGFDPEISCLPDPLWPSGKADSRWQPLPGAPEDSDPSGLKGLALANKRIVDSLLRSVETDAPCPVGIHEARATLEMILAVYAAHLSGGRASFPLKDRRHPLGPLK
jgi:predicted dehydrogenase